MQIKTSPYPHKSELQKLLTFANEIADKARALILDLWQQPEIGTKLKDDRTPVTEVDLRTERLVRDLINETYPTHGVIGEEYEPINPDSDYQWTIDPIDGTQNLVNRIPTFGTLLGLRFKNRAVIGIVDHPALNLRCSGGTGLGVTINGAPAKIEDLQTDILSDNDIIATNNIAVFGRSSDGISLFNSVISVHPHTRIYYDCYVQSLTLSNSLAVVVEPNLKIWDLTPAEALIPEAGGTFQYFNENKHTGHTTLYNAVFGKPRAVQLMMKNLEMSGR